MIIKRLAKGGKYLPWPGKLEEDFIAVYLRLHLLKSREKIEYAGEKGIVSIVQLSITGYSRVLMVIRNFSSSMANSQTSLPLLISTTVPISVVLLSDKESFLPSSLRLQLPSAVCGSLGSH